jgi:hypothetical protein
MSMSYHCYQLSMRMPTLIRKIHMVITIKSLMIWLSINLIRRKFVWKSSGLWFRVRSKIGWIRIGSWELMIFLSRKSWFLIDWFLLKSEESQLSNIRWLRFVFCFK